jgi:hypothetical protein
MVEDIKSVPDFVNFLCVNSTVEWSLIDKDVVLSVNLKFGVSLRMRYSMFLFKNNKEFCIIFSSNQNDFFVDVSF